MDPAKLAIFLVLFFVFLYVARRLAAGNESRLYLSTPARDSGNLSPQPAGEEEEEPGQPALTGADLPFPVSLPPVERDASGKYLRPIIRNYYFGKLDLVSGPADRKSFCDDFYVQFENPDSGYLWTAEYTVATASGLEQLMRSENYTDLILEGPVVIVDQWDIGHILKTVLDDYMEKRRSDLIEKQAQNRQVTE